MRSLPRLPLVALLVPLLGAAGPAARAEGKSGLLSVHPDDPQLSLFGQTASQPGEPEAVGMRLKLQPTDLGATRLSIDARSGDEGSQLSELAIDHELSVPLALLPQSRVSLGLHAGHEQEVRETWDLGLKSAVKASFEGLALNAGLSFARTTTLERDVQDLRYTWSTSYPLDSRRTLGLDGRGTRRLAGDHASSESRLLIPNLSGRYPLGDDVALRYRMGYDLSVLGGQAGPDLDLKLELRF